jgi:hypothetical protein
MRAKMVKLGVLFTLFGVFLFYANPYGMRFVSAYALQLEEWRGFAPVFLSIGAIFQIRKPPFFIGSSLLFILILLSFNRFEYKTFEMGQGAPLLEYSEDGVQVKIWGNETEIFSIIFTDQYSKESLWASYRAVRRVANFLRNKSDKKIVAVLDLPFNERARLYSIFGEVSRLKGFRDNDKIVFSNHI